MKHKIIFKYADYLLASTFAICLNSLQTDIYKSVPERIFYKKLILKKS